VELICPVCKKFIEISEREACVGGRCRCRKCWGIFSIKSLRPLQLVIGESAQDREELISASQGGNTHA